MLDIILAKGERVFFWLDSWTGDCPLALQFSDLFKCARHKDANVHNYLERGVNWVIWGPIFRRNLMENKERQFVRMLNLLKHVHMMEGEEDNIFWAPSNDGKFLVLSSFQTFSVVEV